MTMKAKIKLTEEIKITLEIIGLFLSLPVMSGILLIGLKLIT
jgi:hypothetical protein